MNLTQIKPKITVLTPQLSQEEKALELQYLPLLSALMPNDGTFVANSIKGKFRNYRKNNPLPEYFVSLSTDYIMSFSEHCKQDYEDVKLYLIYKIWKDYKRANLSMLTTEAKIQALLLNEKAVLDFHKQISRAVRDCNKIIEASEDKMSLEHSLLILEAIEDMRNTLDEIKNAQPMLVDKAIKEIVNGLKIELLNSKSLELTGEEE